MDGRLHLSLIILCNLELRHIGNFVFLFGPGAGIAAGYGLDDRGVGVRVPVGARILSSPLHPDRLWGSPSLLFNGYRWIFPEGKAVGA
jgi:hypothetical protein